MTTLDAVAEIIKEDLPKDAKFSHRQSRDRDFIVVEIWARRIYIQLQDAHPLRFELAVIDKGSTLVIHDIKWPDTITGKGGSFRLDDPDVFKKVYSYFALRCVL